MFFTKAGLNKKAITIIELIVTIILVGTLSSMAVPMFTKMIETTRAREARVALQQIRTAERIYHSEESTYLPLPLQTVEDDIRAINAALNVFLPAGENRSWDYSLEAPTANTFRAEAIRRGGRNAGEKIIIDETGTLNEDAWSP